MSQPENEPCVCGQCEWCVERENEARWDEEEREQALYQENMSRVGGDL